MEHKLENPMKAGATTAASPQGPQNPGIGLVRPQDGGVREGATCPTSATPAHRRVSRHSQWAAGSHRGPGSTASPSPTPSDWPGQEPTAFHTCSARARTAQGLSALVRLPASCWGTLADPPLQAPERPFRATLSPPSYLRARGRRGWCCRVTRAPPQTGPPGPLLHQPAAAGGPG